MEGQPMSEGRPVLTSMNILENIYCVVSRLGCNIYGLRMSDVCWCVLGEQFMCLLFRGFDSCCRQTETGCIYLYGWARSYLANELMKEDVTCHIFCLWLRLCSVLDRSQVLVFLEGFFLCSFSLQLNPFMTQSFSQILSNDTPSLTHEGKVWSVLCKFIVWGWHS